MEWQRLSCDSCRSEISASGECKCEEAFLIKAEDEEEIEFYRQQIVDVIRFCVQIGVPGVPKDLQQISAPAVENISHKAFAKDTAKPRTIYDIFYAFNGFKIELNRRFERYPGKIKGNLKSESTSSNPHPNKDNNSSLSLRIIADWDGSFPFSRLEIVADECGGLEWGHILQDLETRNLNFGVSAHFYGWMWNRSLVCWQCEKPVCSTSGECGCYETAILGTRKDDQETMDYYRYQLLKVLHFLLKYKIPSPSDMPEDTPYEWRDALYERNKYFRLALFSENGVFISVRRWFSNYAAILRRNWNKTWRRVGNQGLEQDVEEENFVDSNSAPYTLRLRLRCNLEEICESELEILGLRGDLNWGKLIEDVESKKANLSWSFYALGDYIPEQILQSNGNEGGNNSRFNDQEYYRHEEEFGGRRVSYASDHEYYYDDEEFEGRRIRTGDDDEEEEEDQGEGESEGGGYIHIEGEEGEMQGEDGEGGGFQGEDGDYVQDEEEYQRVINASIDGPQCWPPPAAKSAVEKLTTTTEAGECEGEKMDTKCPICLEDDGELKRKMPCDHVFHDKCIVEWLSLRNFCPVCKYRLPTENIEYEERMRINGHVH